MLENDPILYMSFNYCMIMFLVNKNQIALMENNGYAYNPDYIGEYIRATKIKTSKFNHYGKISKTQKRQKVDQAPTWRQKTIEWNN